MKAPSKSKLHSLPHPATRRAPPTPASALASPLARAAARTAAGLSALLAFSACPASLPTPRCDAPPGLNAGCEPDPTLALIAYRDLLVANRPREAFTWLHESATEGLDADGFAELFAKHRDALIAQAEALIAIAQSQPPEELARVKTDAGEVLVVKTRDGWRLSAPPGPVEPAPR